MLNTNGSTSRGNARMMVNVVMSSVTRVPFTSLLLSSFVLHPTTYLGPELAFTMNLSSSNCLKTSPIICPIDCNAFKSSSVLSNLFRMSINSNLDARTRASNSYVIARHHDIKPSVTRSNPTPRTTVRVHEPSLGLSVARDLTLCCSNNPAYFLSASFLGSGGGAGGVVIASPESPPCGVCGVSPVACVSIASFAPSSVVIARAISVPVFARLSSRSRARRRPRARRTTTRDRLRALFARRVVAARASASRSATASSAESNDFTVARAMPRVFVPGRVCLLGEHSDWAGARAASDGPGACVVVGTREGVSARCDVGEGPRFRVVGADGDAFECDVRVDDALEREASSGGYWSYVAGTALEVLRRFPRCRARGLVVEMLEATLPTRKGLSSSAAACVLVARCFGAAYGLELDVKDEMELAYRGEAVHTPSKCGAMDQACAYGSERVVALAFDGEDVDVRACEVGGEIHIVVCDLAALKNTVRILADLQGAFDEGRGAALCARCP